MPVLGAGRVVAAAFLVALMGFPTRTIGASSSDPVTATPIRYLVVIFQENVSFDHYFGTYPHAANLPGEPRFVPAAGTPSVNNLTQALLTRNPNAATPFRLDRAQALTCDMNHAYTAEQLAYWGGLVDKFVEFTGSRREGCDPRQVMGYFDGNTVTALWNYAQHFAMSDNYYGSTFGPSTPGALEIVSGQTHGATPADVPERVVNGTVIGDLDPAYDDCSNHKGPTAAMSGRNVGDLLNARGITWGWFQGGFRPTARAADGTAVCDAVHANIGGHPIRDYVPHHEPFQYYRDTANPHHLPPSSVAMIGRNDQANHQYDLSDFWAAAEAGNLPAVSYLKAPGYQNGHAGTSDPLDEQVFIVSTVNRLEQLPTWSSMAIIITYDDSDGWYDHVMPPIVNPSSDPQHDLLLGVGLCGQARPGAYPDRCGYGPRLPLLVVSPWARVNFVDHRITDQTSVLRFIEDNWYLGRIGDQSFDALASSLAGMFSFTGPRRARALFLDPATGALR